jgi:hypothetical protein
LLMSILLFPILQDNTPFIIEPDFAMSRPECDGCVRISYEFIWVILSPPYDLAGMHDSY